RAYAAPLPSCNHRVGFARTPHHDGHHDTSQSEVWPHGLCVTSSTRYEAGNETCNTADMKEPDATLDQPSAPAAPPRIRVLVNPHSGAKGGLPTNHAAEEDVRAALDANGLEADIVITSSEEEAVAATRDAIQQGYEVVAAAGGDGTIGTVACELLH